MNLEFTILSRLACQPPGPSSLQLLGLQLCTTMPGVMWVLRPNEVLL